MAEGNGLLNRRRGKTSTEGSNPSLSATVVNRSGYPESARVGAGRRDLVARASWGAHDPPIDQLP